MSRPIIIVTGANSGVGFGICHRLLIQLSQSTPPDAGPQFWRLDQSSVDEHDKPLVYDGLTLILACRSEKRALLARLKLFRLLDEHIARERRRPDYDGHAELFRENLQINIHCIDMASIHSIFQFGEELSQKYPYISHLICNAGIALWDGLNIIQAIRDLCRPPILIGAVTLPQYYYQHVGKTSEDGLGLVWQCNVFGHFVLYRCLERLFTAYARTYGRPARTIWMSTLEAVPVFYDREDWQLLKTKHSYETSKYQLELIVNQLTLRGMAREGEAHAVRHFVVQPGLAHSNITKQMVGSFLDSLKIVFFYIARWLGSPNHTISPYNAAVSAVHLALVSLVLIPASLHNFKRAGSRTSPPTSLYTDSLFNMRLYQSGGLLAEDTDADDRSNTLTPIKFNSQTDRNGREYVGAQTVLEWKRYKEEGEFLLDKCEGMYQSYRELETRGKSTNGAAITRDC